MTDPIQQRKKNPKSSKATAALNAGGVEVPFEESIGRLEKIVNQLEQGNLSLEDTLREFEAGVAAAKNCAKQLAAADERIQVLTREGGELVARAMEAEDDAGLPSDDDFPF